MPTFLPPATSRLSRQVRVGWDRMTGARHAATPWGEVVARMQAARPAAVGFDAFDTLLLRAVPDRVQHLRILADRLVDAGAWPAAPAEFVRARLQLARARRPTSLSEWYRHHPALAAAHARADLCCTIEFNLERDLCRPAPGAAAALGLLRAFDLPVDVVADTPLPASIVRALLERGGLRHAADGLLVSCEVNAGKADGQLFHAWATQRGVPAGCLTYIGNNPMVDHIVPRGLGLVTVPRRAANPNPHESMLARSSVLGAFLAGASIHGRLDRLRLRHEAELATHGASTTGQALLAFLLWVRDRGRDDGVDAITFDGLGAPLAQRLATSLPARYWDGIEVLPPGHRCDPGGRGHRPARLAVAVVGPVGTGAESALPAWHRCRCEPAAPSVLPLSLTADDHPLGRAAPATWSFLPPGSGVPAVVLAPDDAAVWAAATATARALPGVELLSPYLHEVDHLSRPVSALLRGAAPARRVGGTTRSGQVRPRTDRWIQT